jgi:outer membrane protein assembly factor BamA
MNIKQIQKDLKKLKKELDRLGFEYPVVEDPKISKKKQDFREQLQQIISSGGEK